MQMMARARFVVCPSECYDAMPLVVLEAFSAGVPVIASGIGGFLESVEHYKTGLHVEPGNADDLARVARRLAEDLALNKQMGDAAHQTYMSRYAPEQNYRRLVEIYRCAQQVRATRSA